MSRALPLAAMLFLAGVSPVHAYTELTSHEISEGIGKACLTGGTLVGLAAFFAGPATVGTLVGAGATAATVPTSLTTGASAMLGCGASAATAVIYYGGKWAYDLFWAERRYPLLYPMRQDLSEGNQ